MAAILDFGGHLGFVLRINHTCLKLCVIFNYSVNFHHLILMYTAAIIYSYKTVNNGGHLGFWRPYWILKSCIPGFYESFYVYLQLCQVSCFSQKVHNRPYIMQSFLALITFR